MATLALLIGSHAGAASFTIGVGSEYSSGTYGSLDRTNIVSVPVFARVGSGPFTLRVSSSWLRVTGPGTIVPSGIGGIGVSGGASVSDSNFSAASSTTVGGTENSAISGRGVNSGSGTNSGSTSSGSSGGSTSGGSTSGGSTSGGSTSGGSTSGGSTSGGSTSGGSTSGGSTSGGSPSGGSTTSGGTSSNSGSGGGNNSGSGGATTGTTTAAATATTPSSGSTGNSAAATAVRRTQQGFADIVAALTCNLMDAQGIYLDLTGRIKFATASDSRGLGSGKNDYALQIDGEKSFGATFVTGGIGYKWLGDANDNSLVRVWYGAIGAGHKFTADDTLGLSYNHAAAAQVGGFAAREGVVYYSHRFDRHFRVNANVIKGLSDGSADWAAGVSIAYTF